MNLVSAGTLFSISLDKVPVHIYFRSRVFGNQTSTCLAPEPTCGFQRFRTGYIFGAGLLNPMAEKHWIQKAIKHPGALHRQLGVPQGTPIPASKLAAAAKKGGVIGQRARLAQTLKRMH